MVVLSPEVVEEVLCAMESPVTCDTRPTEMDPSLLQSHVGKWIQGWTGDPGWVNFGFVYDRQILPTVHAFPHIYEYIRNVSKRGRVSMAGLSWIRPGCSIPPHVDEKHQSDTDNVYHLGLLVPRNCWLDIDGVRVEEAPGKEIWFNDSTTHAAYNDSHRDRVILYVKVDRVT